LEGKSCRTGVIKDDAEKHKKIVWLENISGVKQEKQIRWDGKFADGTKAGVGSEVYFITLKISDEAGNEMMRSAVVSMNLLNSLLPILPFTPPTTAALTPSLLQGEDGMMDFGGTNSAATGETTSSSTSGGTRAEGVIRESQEWTTKPVSSNPVFPVSNILWGAAATALVSAMLTEWEKQRKEANEIAKHQAFEDRQANGPSTFRQIGMAYQRLMDNFKATLNEAVNKGMSKPEIDQLKKNVIDSGKIGASLDTTKKYIRRLGSLLITDKV